MSGASGPTVTVHTPFSSFVSGCGWPSSSPDATTDFAFGAKSRSVSFLSALTSGDATCGGPPRPPPCRPGCALPIAGTASASARIPINDNDRSFRIGSALPEHQRRDVVQRVAPDHPLVATFGDQERVLDVALR